VTPARRLEAGAAAKAGEVAERGIDDEDDVAPAAAIAPIGTALRHVRLAPERDHTVAAGAAPHVDTRAVVEHG
jgi:hypothetical protein